MIVGWLLDAATSVLNWVLDRFASLGVPSFTFPSSLSVTVPVPFIGSNLGALNMWWTASLAIVACLFIGRVFVWLYRLIPMNG